MTFNDELPQWPLLQVVLVPEILDGEVLQTLLVANRMSKVFKY